MAGKRGIPLWDTHIKKIYCFEIWDIHSNLFDQGKVSGRSPLAWKTFSGDFSGPVKKAQFSLRTKKNSTG